MKDSTKKPVFEPVSAEEAKKIRATVTRDMCESATECPSGGSPEERRFAACENRGEGCACCWDGDGGTSYGRCWYVPATSGSSFHGLKCLLDSEHHSERKL